MEQQIRVLMVGPDRGVHGGISAVVNEFYAAGLNEKVKLKYIGTMKEGSKVRKLCVAAFAFAHFAFGLLSCDVVHVHFSSDMSFMRKSYFIRMAHFCKKRIILHQHGGDFTNFYKNQLDDKGKAYVKRVLEMGEVMLVLTESWKEFFSQIIDENRLLVFPNGVRTSGFTYPEKEECNDCTHKDRNKILFLGRVCKDKGMDELLEAIGAVHEHYPKAHLYIGGIYEDESYRKKIEECADFVTFLGWITGKEKDKYLEECGMLVLPSYYEGFPVSVIEAMLHNMAVIACNVGGLPDIIENDVDGLLIPPKNSKKLEQAIERVIEDEEFAGKLGNNGVRKVLSKYSVEENINRLVGIYSRNYKNFKKI